MRLVSFRTGAAVLFGIVAVLLGSGWRVGEATVRPVRLDEQLSSSPVLQASDSHVLDAYRQAVTSPGQGGTVELVPPDVIASLCGDGDGCSLRLAGFGSWSHAENLVARLFSTAADGRWRVFEFDGTYQSGSTTDGTFKAVVQVGASDGYCAFRETLPLGTLGSYQLKAERFSAGTEIDCVLRIDD